MPGHVFPLLATAEALALRGYTVTVTTLKHLERTVKNHKHPLVHYVPIGECQNAVDDWDKLTREMNSIVEFTESSNKIYELGKQMSIHVSFQYYIVVYIVHKLKWIGTQQHQIITSFHLLIILL
eukprot:UN08574